MREIPRNSIVVILALLFSLPVFAQENKKEVDELNLQLNKIAYVIQAIHYTYVDSVKDERLVEDAILQMLKELDPHSYYISKEELREADEPMMGSFEGIGVSFQIFNDTLYVIAPIPGGPSEKVGILAGDRIVEIDGDKSYGDHVNNKFVFDHLKGPKGTKVNIKVYREGWDKLLDFEIIRDKIPVNSIDATFMATKDIGYIRLNRFSLTTYDEYTESVRQLKKQGMKKLILDLRGNSGGVMQPAIDIADDLLSDDKLIVYTEGRAQPRKDYNSTYDGYFEEGELVVLIDEGSASSSEILSGAVQDWDRGIIVGRRSFGKGLVQNPFMLPDGSAVRLTVARYYTPTGRSIQKPYDKGLVDYYSDIYNRLRKGELVDPSKIEFPDSLKYTTPGGRIVYGGGGIMPDVFIPWDSTQYSNYYTDLVRKRVFNEFVIKFMEGKHDKFLAKYSDIKDFDNKFEMTDKIIQEFIKYGEDRGVKYDEEGFKQSEDQIVYSIKALISRNLWTMDGYFLVMSAIDEGYQKAIQILEDKGEFKELSLL